MRTHVRTALIVAMVVLLLAPYAGAQLDALTAGVAQLAGRPGPMYVPDQLVVQFRENASQERQAGVLTEMGSRLIYSAASVPGLHVVTVPPGMTLAQAIGVYAARLDVAYAEPNYLDHPFWTPNDPYFKYQWNFQLIKMPTAWNTQKGGKSTVKVAVVDTGVAYKSISGHPQAPDLAGATFVSPHNCVDSTLPVDVEGHGTHVTGTIAERTNNKLGVAGIAFGTAIMPVRTLGGTDGGTHAQFSEGIHWAVDHGAKVINYSAGGSDSTTKHNAVKYAYSHGVLVVAAMGNDGLSNSVNAYPGRYSEAIGIGAVTPSKKRASYSNYGTGIDLVAPGGDTTSTSVMILQNTFGPRTSGGASDPTNMGYWYMAGTSMATPHVTGTAALLLAKKPTLTLSQLKTLLLKNTEDLGTKGYDSQYGYGLVRPDLALKAEAALSAAAAAEPAGRVTGLAAVPTNGAGAQLNFTLSSDAAVTVTVLNIAGRQVRTIAVGRDYEAGLNTLLWDGRNDSGVQVPRGTYVVRVSAQAASGDQSNAVATLHVAR